MTRNFSFFDLREALSDTGCAMCRLSANVADRYLDSLLWENVNDPSIRDAIRQARGFCYEHSQCLRRHGAALGVSIIARDVLQGILDTLQKEPSSRSSSYWSLSLFYEAITTGRLSGSAKRTVAQLMPQAICPVCAQVEDMERIYFYTLFDNLLDQEGLLADFRASDGLCLRHFCQALTFAPDSITYEALVDAQRSIWQVLVNQLGEAIRKSDWRFRDEPKGEEMKAWVKALSSLAGNTHHGHKALR